MEQFREVARKNQERAREIIRETGVVAIWESIGAEVREVGSLSTGLLVKHRDIDFHVYSAPLRPYDSFQAMARLAERDGIRKVEYVNLLDTEERCIEWHAWYEDVDGETWQLDMIHILKGSRYDGYFERMTERIREVLTDETRDAILRLKYETPGEVKIAGVEYYQAVLEDGVRRFDELLEWKERHPGSGIIEWMP